MQNKKNQMHHYFCIKCANILDKCNGVKKNTNDIQTKFNDKSGSI